jgi:outer membrane receptor protein involved in Fe transport
MKIFEPMKFRQNRMFSEGLQGGPFAILSLLLAAAIITFAPLNAHAQTETGQIVGTISDSQGAVISGAKIKIVNIGTGAERNVTSDSQGNFTAANLLPALYEITVEASGFTANKTRAQVTVGSRVTADFQLNVGGTQQVVEVVAGAGVQVNTETQTVAEVIDGKKITELPTVTRNPYAFVITAGNVSPGDPNNMAARGVGVAINGLRSASTNVLLDGAANNDEFSAGVGQSVPLDAVQEYSIITNNFTAEFGRATGGIVNVATKAGTNDYHGTAYEFGRYSRLNSNSFQNNANIQPKNVYTRNQFGYSLGGPVIKEKLFFFQSTEFLRVRSSNTQFVVVPTPQFIGLADPATQNFFNQFGALKDGVTNLGTLTRQSFIDSGAADPCASSPVCAARTSLTTPLFTRLAFNTPADSGGGDPQNTYNLVGRMDWNISETTQLYGRYALERAKLFDGSVSNSPYQGFDTGQETTNNSFVLSLTRTFSPQLILQSKGVYNRLNTVQSLSGNASPTLYFQDTRPTRFLGNLAPLPGYLPFNPGVAIPFGGPQNFLQAYQDVNYIKGPHNFRFGGSYVYIQDNRTFGAFQNPVLGLGTNAVPPALDNFLLGRLARFQGAIDPQGKTPCANPAAPDPSCTVTLPVNQPNFSRSNLYHEFALYGQDSWRIRPNFTVNLGLRYEYFGVQHNKDKSLDSNYYDADSDNIFQAIRNGDVATGRGLWEPDYNNFAPRLGFAWDIFGNGKTSLRGGYGIGYERNFGNVTFNVIQNPPNYAVIAVTPLNSGTGVVPISTNLTGPLAGSTGSAAIPQTSLRNVDSNIRTAYAHFYSVSLEREVARNLVVSLDYSGSMGEKLYSIEDPNRLGSGNVFLGDPFDPTVNQGLGTRLRTTKYTNINRRGGKGFSDYNAFNLRVNINNFANSGLRLTTNYTYSHAIDNLSSTFSESNNNFNLGLLDPFNPDLDRGNADFDIRQRFVVSGVWELPFARGTKGVYKQILDGWEVAPIITAQTGTPFTIFDCTAFAPGLTVCPRLFQTGALPRKGVDNPAQDPSTPGTFTYLSVDGLFDSSFVNPILGHNEVGPYPSNMIGRNAFRGPGSVNTDLGVYKNFQLTERFKLQYRAEFYNLFNHANAFILGSGADVSSQPFVSTQKDGNRNIQMALKLIF